MIFWKHIKGLSTNSVYSFVRFSGIKINDYIQNGASIDNLPQIWLNLSGSFSTVPDEHANINCGHILTTDMTDGYTNNAFCFNNSVTIKDFLLVQSNVDKIKLSAEDSAWLIDSSIKMNIKAKGSIEVSNTSSTTVSDTITISSKNNNITLNKQITSNKIILDYFDETYDGSCTAKYFNATSDYRAKKDFKLLDINALELIKKVQLYSFKYKESNQSSIGIIAQDVQDVNINGFELVDNKEASGANFDYMSIHESKLVYILWKAIQEQQKEIEELKKLIK